ncbi:MAG: hypothetical protein F6J95_031665 [Leptolyngbya sp. SIO1E4]|nr:hypothetical protein [Leptolyngbya sp. SIO1E4]
MSVQNSPQLPKLPSADQREAYQAKVAAELDKLNAQIDEFRAKADQAKAEAEATYYSRVEELAAQRDALLVKWQEVQSASEAAWQDINTGFEAAWNELAQAFDNAIKHFS